MILLRNEKADPLTPLAPITTSPEALGIVIVLSAVGSPPVRVVSKSSAVVPSKITPLPAPWIVTSPVVTVRDVTVAAAADEPPITVPSIVPESMLILVNVSLLVSALVATAVATASKSAPISAPLTNFAGLPVSSASFAA